MKELLKQLRESPDFQSIMTEMLKSRPLVPSYTPQKTRDLTEHLVEQIKHQSSMQQGWDLLYQAMTGDRPQ